MVSQSFVTKLLLFVSGFAILALEILGIRVLGPYTGTTIPVWAAIISVTLAGSALGYYLGGFLADRTREKSFFLALVIAASFCIALIPTSRGVVSVIPLFSYGTGALLGATFLLLVPTLCLSALITYSIRTSVRDLGTIAQVHGDLYGLATVGSAVGIFATSYLLVPLFTVPHILYGLAGVVLLLGALAGTFKTSAG